MTKNQSKWLVGIIVGGGAFLLLIICLFALLLFSLREGEWRDFGFGNNKIGLVDLNGVIFESKAVVDQLQKLADDPSIKAIVLRIDSPGGGVAASQEIYNEILRIKRKKNKVIVSSMASVGASGAYYIACGTDRIVANAGTITGSIGVIAEWYNYGELMKWAKLKNVVFKSGELKDAPSPVRELTEPEKKYLQNLIDDMYSQFLTAVAEGRKLDLETVRKFSDGRVYTGRDAKSKKLIDEIGSLQDAIDIAAKLARISGEPRLVNPPRNRTTLLDLLMGDVSSFLPNHPGFNETRIQFSYLWR
jgi:protease IV